MKNVSRLAMLAAVTLALALAASRIVVAQSGDASVVSLIEPIRKDHNLPALGAALITSQGLVSSGVAGVRKAKTDVAATVDDHWHLGSDTKAMTAVVLAILVERGTLTWDTSLGQVFPELASTFPANFRAITITQLLSHYAGLPPNLTWRAIARSSASVPEQRLNALKEAAKSTLSSNPGTRYEYSNLGYTIAGAIAERAAGQPWESLIREMVFTLLGMTNCGFGGLGTPGKIDQPWPHGQDGEPRPSNGPEVDNPPVLGPAGTVHCSIQDWSKFIADQHNSR